MPKPRPVFLVLLCAVALATAGSALARSGRGASVPTAHAARGCGRTSLIPRRTNFRLIARITLCLVNRQRAAHGLRPLRANGALTRAARGHSVDMVRRGYFSHVTPQGVGPFQRMLSTGYGSRRRACALGENIAAATGSFSTPARIVSTWMNSPGHRANILSRSFRDTGMGVAFGFPGAGGARGATYTQDFGAHC